MTNKIIEAWNAQADHMNQWGSLGEDEKIAWAYRQALEDAARVCDRGAEMMLHGYKREGAARCAESIRALKEQQHG